MGSHRLVPKSMTLDDLERPKRHSCRSESFGAHQKNLNEDRSIPLAAKCKPMLLVSKNIKYMSMRILVWVPAVKQFGREDSQHFHHFSLTYL